MNGQRQKIFFQNLYIYSEPGPHVVSAPDQGMTPTPAPQHCCKLIKFQDNLLYVLLKVQFSHGKGRDVIVTGIVF
jgi:hypothetical protein